MNKQITALLTAGLVTGSSVPAGPTELLPEQEPVVHCPTCTNKEERTLAFLEENGVTDPNAQAVVLGTIKQESRWEENVCEGGAITSYQGCTSGGWGLIQWTHISRYLGLGQYAKNVGSIPECFDTQLAYILTEPEWKRVEHVFKTEGLPLWRYEQAEYQWIGWGIQGNRDLYTRQYLTQIA
jgi:hypothetical protein